MNIVGRVLLAIGKDIKNGYHRRQYIIITSKIKIAEAQIRIKDEVLNLKPGRQRTYELARIQKAEIDLPKLRDILADYRKMGFD